MKHEDIPAPGSSLPASRLSYAFQGHANGTYRWYLYELSHEQPYLVGTRQHANLTEARRDMEMFLLRYRPLPVRAGELTKET